MSVRSTMRFLKPPADRGEVVPADPGDLPLVVPGRTGVSGDPGPRGPACTGTPSGRWRAAAWVLGQARRQRAQLVFVYISVIPAWVAFEPQLVPHWRAGLAKLAAGIGDQLEAVLGEAGVSWEFLHREGHPATELARAADVLRADTVVVGASRHWLRRAGLSAAGGLLRSGHWPVTVVP